jgi:hypothetical protein
VDEATSALLATQVDEHNMSARQLATLRANVQVVVQQQLQAAGRRAAHVDVLATRGCVQLVLEMSTTDFDGGYLTCCC